MEKKFQFIQEALQQREEKKQLRSLGEVTPLQGVKVLVDGKQKINFSSNDFLGLANDSRLQKRAIEFIQQYGTGSTASRLICGSYPCHEKVEQKLAELKETESALLLNGGYQANVSILATLADRNSLVLADRLNHNSLVQGAILSRAKVRRFRHNNLQHLRKLLEKIDLKQYSRIFIVTESIFSMDGDQADIDALITLAEEFDAFLIVDEAHATGVIGKNGMGMTTGKRVDLAIGTFGKAFGSFGAYVACSQKIAEYLVNFCGGFIYTTAPSPAVVGAIDAALDCIPAMNQEREHLQQNSDFLRRELNQIGFDTVNSSTQIIPVVVGEEKEALDLADYLLTDGFLAMAIRPPTVAQGQARIRLSLSSLHTQEQVKQLIEIFRSWRAKSYV